MHKFGVDLQGQRFFIADPGLVNQYGHHFSTSMILAEVGRQRFDGVVVVGNASAGDVLREADVRPVFHDSIYDAAPPLVPMPEDPNVVEARIPRPAADFLGLLRDYQVRVDDLVYFHTLTPRFACSLLDAMALIPPGRLPQVAMMFRFDPEDEAWVGGFAPLKAALDRAEGQGGKGWLSLFCETDELASHFAAALGRHVETARHFSASLPENLDDRPAGRKVTVGYLGEARWEKGFDAFAAALHELASTPLAAEITFSAQVYQSGNDSSPPKGIMEAVEALRSLAKAFDGQLFDVLNAREYAELLEKVDILVAPHRLPNYARRGAGVFVDALAVGAIAVVREGTSMSCRQHFENVVLFREDAALPVAIAEAVELARRRSRSRLVEASAEEFSAQAHIEKIAGFGRSRKSERLTMTPRKPRALVITKFWPSTGAAHVFRSQIQMLKAAGFDVSVATVTSYAAGSDMDENAYEWHRKEMRFPEVSFHWVCFANAAMLDSMQEIAGGMVGVEQSWTAEAMRAIATDLPLSLKEACQDTPPELILCNYLSHLPLASRLKGPETKIIVETHDICSVQYATTNDHSLSESDYRAELSAGRMADGLVFINPQEAEAFQAAGVLTPALTVLPGREMSLNFETTTQLEEALQAEDASAAVTVTQDWLARLVANASNPAGSVRAGAALRRAWEDRKVLIYVGSDHIWNIRGLQSFIDTVFLPKLAEEGYQLVVSGSSWEWVAKTYPQVESIVPIGVVPNLQPLYEAPATVVLPVTGGTGFPIKTLDALQSGLPVVGTPEAFRGVLPDTHGALVVDIQDMAEAIREAVALPFVRNAPPEVTKFSTYIRKWADFLSEILEWPVEIADDMISPVPEIDVTERVADALAVRAEPLIPLPHKKHLLADDGRKAVLAASFGFHPKDGEPDWLWSSSWYFGFLLDGEWRGTFLQLDLIGCELADWASVGTLHVVVDGRRMSFEYSADTRSLRIPLFERERAPEAPVLVECFAPAAAWKKSGALSHEDRVLSLGVLQLEPLDEPLPLRLSMEELDALDTPDFINQMYALVLGKEADAEGLAYYNQRLSEDMPRSEMINLLAQETESLYPHGVILV